MAEGTSKLSEEQIFEFLKTLNVPVRMSDIKVPNKEFIVRVFEYFLRDLEVEMNKLKTWTTVSHLEDFSIYEEPTFLLSLAMTVNHITSPLELNITLKDILEPKPKRTKKILNYLLVFWNYYLVRCARFHSIRDAYEGEVKKAEDLELDNQSLDEKYKEKVEILKNMQPSKEELSDIVSVKQEKVTKLEKESKAVGAQYEDLKVKETKLCEEVNSIQVDITETENAIHELEQHILSSPSRINNELQNLTNKIKVEDEKIKECENKFKETEKKINNLEDIMQEDDKDSKLLSQFLELNNSVREKVKETVILRETMCEGEEKLKKLQTDLNRKQESKLQQDQMSAKLLLNSKKHFEKVKEMFKISAEQESSRVQELESLKTKEKCLQQNIDTISDVILETIEKLKDVDSKCKTRRVQFVSNRENIKRSFQSDCEEVHIAAKTKFFDRQ